MLDDTDSEATARGAGDVAWPDPDRTLLGPERGSVKPFPVEALPPFWQGWCMDVAQSAGVPLDYVALALLTTAAGLIGSNRRISPTPAWTEPCVLWTVLVGGPSSGKTPGMESSLRLVRALDRELDGLNEGHRRGHVVTHERARAEIWWWRDRMRGAAANKRESPEMPAAACAPQRFMPRRLLIEDPAIAAVAEALRGNPRGVVLATDPMDAWLNGTARAPAGDPVRSLWLKAWSAAGWSTLPGSRSATAAEGSWRIESAAVSILGALRPGDALTALVADEDVAARMLFVWPGDARVRPLSAAAAQLDDAALRALAGLRDLRGEPRIVALSAEACTAFEAFRRDHAATPGLERLESVQLAAWGKGPGTVLRLAGVLTFLDWAAQADGIPEPDAVSGPALQAGICLWACLWWHTRAVLDTMGDGKIRQRARKALRWIRGQGLTRVSREDLWRRARCASRAADAEMVIGMLVDAGWLHLVDRGPPQGRGRPPQRWDVNPALMFG